MLPPWPWKAKTTGALPLPLVGATIIACLSTPSTLKVSTLPEAWATRRTRSAVYMERSDGRSRSRFTLGLVQRAHGTNRITDDAEPASSHIARPRHDTAAVGDASFGRRLD